MYRAIQPVVGRDVEESGLQRPVASDPDFVRRFEHTAQAIASLEHPHIAPVHDYWREPGPRLPGRPPSEGRQPLRGREQGPMTRSAASGRGAGRPPRSPMPTDRGSRMGTSPRRASCSMAIATPTSWTSASSRSGRGPAVLTSARSRSSRAPATRRSERREHRRAGARSAANHRRGRRIRRRRTGRPRRAAPPATTSPNGTHTRA